MQLMRKMILALLLMAGISAHAEEYTVSSPDARIRVDVKTGAITTYTIRFDGKTILNPSPLSMTFDNGRTIGRNMKVEKVDRT